MPLEFLYRDRAPDIPSRVNGPNAGELTLRMWMYILRQTLERSLALLAESRGLDWLSEFENQLIKDIKGAVFEGVPIDTEVATIESVIETLKLVFENARSHTIAK
jgi:hypothetical protein